MAKAKKIISRRKKEILSQSALVGAAAAAVYSMARYAPKNENRVNPYLLAVGYMAAGYAVKKSKAYYGTKQTVVPGLYTLAAFVAVRTFAADQIKKQQSQALGQTHMKMLPAGYE